MNDEKLILLIQANDCLYNKNSAAYKLSDNKKKVWKEIGEDMQLPAELCMKRWACLRDRYAREKWLENIPSGSGSNLKSQWHHMQSMHFIDPHIIPRPMRSSFNIMDEVITPNLLDTSESESPSPVSSMPLQNATSSIIALTSTPAKKRKRHSHEDNIFSEAVGTFKELCESQKKIEKTPLHGFGEMIVTTIGTMSFKKQVEAMQRVTVLVMEMKKEPDGG